MFAKAKMAAMSIRLSWNAFWFQIRVYTLDDVVIGSFGCQLVPFAGKVARAIAYFLQMLRMRFLVVGVFT